MIYPCGLIRDVLPLFYDGVCSEETSEIVRAHLAECAGCRAEYERLTEAAEALPAPADPSAELRTAAALQRFRRQFFRKRTVIALLSAVLMSALLFVVWFWNDMAEYPMPFNDTLHAYYEESGDLVLRGDLPASVVNINQMLIHTEGETGVEEHVFLRYYVRPLDHFLWKLMGDRIDHTYLVAFDEKGAQQIDAIHYCTADFQGYWFKGNSPADPMSAERFAEYAAAAVTVWEKP